jgi:hypothetical protein
MSLAELEKKVQNLSEVELASFTRWLDEYAAQRWDDQFERDAKAGKLDDLGESADRAFEAGKCTQM